MPLRPRTIARLLYRTALAVGFVLAAIQLFAALNLGLFFELLFGSWTGWLYFALLANPFVTLLLRHTLLEGRATPRNLTVLGVASLSLSAVCLAWAAYH